MAAGEGQGRARQAPLHQGPRHEARDRARDVGALLEIRGRARPPSGSARGGSTAAACAAPTTRAPRPSSARCRGAARSPCTCSRARCAGAPRARAAVSGVQLGLRLGRRAGEGVEHEAGQARGEDGVAVVHAAHGVGQLLARDVLGHVAARAGADHGDHVLGGVGHRQREEARRARAERGRAPDHLDAAAVRHVHVEQHDVGRVRLDRRDRPRSTEPASPAISSSGSSSARTPERNSWWSSTIRTRGSRHVVAPATSSTSVPAPGALVIARAAAVALHPADDRLAHAAPVRRHRSRGRSPARGRARTPACAAPSLSA